MHLLSPLNSDPRAHTQILSVSGGCRRRLATLLVAVYSISAPHVTCPRSPLSRSIVYKTPGHSSKGATIYWSITDRVLGYPTIRALVGHHVHKRAQHSRIPWTLWSTEKINATVLDSETSTNALDKISCTNWPTIAFHLPEAGKSSFHLLGK